MRGIASRCSPPAVQPPETLRGHRAGGISPRLSLPPLGASRGEGPGRPAPGGGRTGWANERGAMTGVGASGGKIRRGRGGGGGAGGGGGGGGGGGRRGGGGGGGGGGGEKPGGAGGGGGGVFLFDGPGRGRPGGTGGLHSQHARAFPVSNQKSADLAGMSN